MSTRVGPAPQPPATSDGATRFERYRAPDAPVAAETWAWNMYGPGVERIGRDGRPERFPVPEPGDDQLLVRVDAVGMCYSDVKLIQQGGRHPKLYNRDLAAEPTRLGHEAALTVLRVGKNLRDRYAPGQRLAMQPDIYVDGRSTAYGYTIPGGLIQFHLIGPEVLAADDGAYVLPVPEGLGYAETALTEPWACVEGAYTQRRRLAPKPGGTMWILGRRDDEEDYGFSRYADAPATVVLSDPPPALAALFAGDPRAVRRDGLGPDDFAALRDELTGGAGFDDIVVLDPTSAELVGAAARMVARRGTVNLVGRRPLDGEPLVDVGRIHYDYTAFVGSRGPDIAASYGEARNRCELRAGGVALFVGAGGPMGQMHVQRALELPDGPRTVIATDVNEARLAALDELFQPIARANGRRLIVLNPTSAPDALRALVERETGGAGADDVVVCVPVAALMAEAARLMRFDGMLVLFAGVPNGTMAPLNLSDVYLHGAQLTGTSGSRLSDQARVIEKTVTGQLSPNRSVAAIGGMAAAHDGIRAMMEGRYAGKVVIFPQIDDLPLMSLAELREAHPDVAAHLGPEGQWTPEAERALIEKLWRPA